MLSETQPQPGLNRDRPQKACIFVSWVISVLLKDLLLRTNWFEIRQSRRALIVQNIQYVYLWYEPVICVSFNFIGIRGAMTFHWSWKSDFQPNQLLSFSSHYSSVSNNSTIYHYCSVESSSPWWSVDLHSTRLVDSKWKPLKQICDHIHSKNFVLWEPVDFHSCALHHIKGYGCYASMALWDG